MDKRHAIRIEVAEDGSYSRVYLDDVMVKGLVNVIFEHDASALASWLPVVTLVLRPESVTFPREFQGVVVKPDVDV